MSALHRSIASLPPDDIAAIRRLVAALVYFRILHGLSRREVAERMGYQTRGVRDLENLRIDPRLSMIRRYALAVGVVIEHTVTPVGDGRHALRAER